MAQAQQAGQPNRRQPGKIKPNKEAHTANTKYGMGDSYGTGVKNKLGKMVDGMGMKTMTSKKLSKPPKSLA